MAGGFLYAGASPMKRPCFVNEIGRDGKVKVGGRFLEPSTLIINSKMTEIERRKTSLMDVNTENQCNCDGRSRGNECAGKPLKIRSTESGGNREKVRGDSPTQESEILYRQFLTIHPIANRGYKGINIRPILHTCIE
jgi:hypothetical protein